MRRSRLASVAPVPDGAPPEDEAEILAGLGFPRRLIALAAERAARSGRGVAEHLIATGALEPERWWRALAAAFGLAYLARVPAARVAGSAVALPPEALGRVRQAWLCEGDRRILVVAPAGAAIPALARLLADEPALAARLRIARPEAIRAAVAERQAVDLVERARRGLIERDPTLSAHTIGLGKIVAALALAAPLVALPLSVASGTGAGALGLLQVAFLTLGILRLVAAFGGSEPAAPPPLAGADLPRYAVLVPLHREAAEVPRLVAALRALDYPRDRLQVLFVAEADDRETVAALRAALPGTGFRALRVPPCRPRTKPKALDYALAFVSADYVTVYDAEDRPDPDQLRRAAAAFAAGPDDLVCLQAALAVDHAPRFRPWLTRQFGLEYALLFGGLLPALARRGHFFPLGGSSNHFRRSALVEAGGWDPHNVTEDADIAVRLVRRGGRLGVLASATGEEAPLTWRAWLGQRTRWMKGWLQTWIVHNRRPFRLWRELGATDFCLFQILLGGQLCAALLYPLSFAAVPVALALDLGLVADRSLAGDVLLAAGLVGLGLGFAGPLALALSLRARGRTAASLADIATMPLYWLLLWPAVLLAFVELVGAPDRWAKTRHGLAERQMPLADPAPGTLSVADKRV